MSKSRQWICADIVYASRLRHPPQYQSTWELRGYRFGTVTVTEGFMLEAFSKASTSARGMEGYGIIHSFHSEWTPPMFWSSEMWQCCDMIDTFMHWNQVEPLPSSKWTKPLCRHSMQVGHTRERRREEKGFQPDDKIEYSHTMSFLRHRMVSY